MTTVGQPGPGAMGVPCMLRSASRAAGKPPIITVALPMAMPLGAGDTHTMPPGMLLATAAGIPAIRTVGLVAAGGVGPPPWGVGAFQSGEAHISPARNGGPGGTPPPS